MSGTTLSRSAPLLLLAAVLGVPCGCSFVDLTGLSGGGGRGEDAGGDATVQVETGSDAGADDGESEASSDAGPFTARAAVALDIDDGTWADPSLDPPTQEQLHRPSPYFFLEVSNDGFHGHSAVRFKLDIPPKATILSCHLTMSAIAGSYDAADAVGVRIYSADTVLPFNDTHVHAPFFHVPEGVSALAASWTLGNTSATLNVPLTSPDLSPLLQTVINRAGWARGNYAGFVLTPTLNGSHWVGFKDSTQGGAGLASIVVSWR